MITKEKIKMGLADGVVKLVTNPTFETGTVCQIGENWFYFGGETADDMSPDEYIAKIPTSDIVREIYDVLDDFKNSGEFMDEYLYYDRVLDESASLTPNYAVSCSYSDEDYATIYLFQTEMEAKEFLKTTLESTAQLYPESRKFETSDGLYGSLLSASAEDHYHAVFQIGKLYE